jgi:hypothetical protein
MSKILRKLNDNDGITIFCPEQSGFCDGLIDNIINHQELSKINIKALLFLECEERNITNLLSKNIQVSSPSNVVFELEKIKIIKYRGFNIEFSIDNNLMDNKEIQKIINAVNSTYNTILQHNTKGKRTKIGVIDCDDLRFFAY